MVARKYPALLSYLHLYLLKALMTVLTAFVVSYFKRSLRASLIARLVFKARNNFKFNSFYSREFKGFFCFYISHF